MSNMLGQALGYVVNAWRYATKSTANAERGRHQVTASLLMQAARQGLNGGNGDMDYFMRLAVTNPWFFSANRVISNRISDTAKFRVEERHQREWVDQKTHDILSVLERPNSIMTGGLLLAATSEWMNAAGNGYWFAVTDQPGRGPIREIWPLPADKVIPDPTRLRISPITGATVIDYRYQLGGVMWLNGENVIHFRSSNLFDYWRGAAPLSALQAILPTDSSQVNWLGSFFGENNAVPTAVISLPPETSDEDFDIIKRDIMEQFGAQRRAAITRAGDMSVEAIQQTIDEMKVIDGLEFNAKAIRAVLNVPKRDELTSGQALLAAEIALMRDAVQPMLNMFAAWMTLKLAPFYEDRPGTLRVIAENVVPQDSAIEVAEYNAYGLDRTLNENRKEQKLEPLRLSGPLASMQPLLDQVPQRYVALLAPILTQAAQPAPAAPGQPGSPGGPPPGSDQALLAQMTGKPTQAPAQAGAAGGDGDLVAQMTGQSPAAPPKPAGVRSTGIENPADLVAQMAGGAVKSRRIASRRRLMPDFHTAESAAIEEMIRRGFNPEVGKTYAERLKRHIAYVQEAGARLGVPQAQLLAHDASKWSSEEFTGYALHFCGGGSPLRFAEAWLHHIHANPHHWQHFLFADGFSIPGSGIVDGTLPMPGNYALEMVADWMGASREYTGGWDMTDWLEKNWGKMKMHPATRLYVADVLIEQGYLFLKDR